MHLCRTWLRRPLLVVLAVTAGLLLLGCPRKAKPKVYQAVDDSGGGASEQKPAQNDPAAGDTTADKTDYGLPGDDSPRKPIAVAGRKGAAKPKRKPVKWNPEDDFKPDALLIEAESGKVTDGAKASARSEQGESFVYVQSGDAAMKIVCPAQVKRNGSCWLWVRGRATSENAGSCTVGLGAQENSGTNLTASLPHAKWTWALAKGGDGQSELALDQDDYVIILQGRSLKIDKILLSFDSPEDFTPKGVKP